MTIAPVVLLLLSHCAIAGAEQIFLSRLLITTDGVPIKRLDAASFAFFEEIRALAINPKTQTLYMILKNPDGHASGSIVDLQTGIATQPFAIALPQTNDGVGLTFDTSRGKLYMLAPHALCELDADLEILSCVPTTPGLPIGDAASLAYDSQRDAFWVLTHTFAPCLFLIDHNANILDSIDISKISDDQGLVAMDFDNNSGTILLETRLGQSHSGRLFRLSPAGAVLEQQNIPHQAHIDSAMAWDPTDPILPSHVIARAGFLRDDGSGPFPTLYTPPPVLFVNGSSGDAQRKVVVGSNEPLVLRIDPPPRFQEAPLRPTPFLLFAVPREASADDASRFSFSNFFLQEVGVAVFPLPFSSGDSSSTMIVVNSTEYCSGGKGRFSLGPAPASLSFPAGVRRPRTVTLQPLFALPPTVSTYARLGNAIVLSIE